MLHRLQKVVRHIAQTEIMPRFLNTPSRRKEDGSMLSEA
ncbi:TPA: inositol monophosphatase, partial [Neisseria gonorrhoeae]